MALLSPFDPFMLSTAAVSALAAIGTLFGLYESGKADIRLGAGSYYKRGLENASAIFYFPAAHLSRADMDVLHGMVVQPIPVNNEGHNAFIYNEGANFSASGFITGLGQKGHFERGIHYGNVSVTLSSHPMKPAEGKWLFVDPDVADADMVEGYRELEKAILGVNDHRALLWDLFDRVAQD